MRRRRVDRCIHGHDVSYPEARYANGACRACQTYATTPDSWVRYQLKSYELYWRRYDDYSNSDRDLTIPEHLAGFPANGRGWPDDETMTLLRKFVHDVTDPGPGRQSWRHAGLTGSEDVAPPDPVG